MSNQPIPKCRNCKYYEKSIFSELCFHAPKPYTAQRIDGRSPACVWFEAKPVTITMKAGGKILHPTEGGEVNDT